MFYRIPQTTPSPTPSNHNPVSPSPLFMTSPTPYNIQNTNGATVNGVANNESILQNQLQAPRNPTSNIFQQQSHTNQIFTPNIPPSYAIENQTNSIIWGGTNNLNGTSVATTSRAAFNSISMTSPIFNQPLTPLAATPVQNFTTTNNNNNEGRSNFSSLLDLDSQQLLSEQMLNNLSGELKNLSFGDYAMESFSNKNDPHSNMHDGMRK